jgi:NADH-quinone oxidoreductase subunit G
MPPEGRDTGIRLSINGTEVEAEHGSLLIDVAEAYGVFVPRFCYHPGMDSVAACRMCLVEVEGSRKLLPACATPVNDGMVVRTDSTPAIEAQRSVLELLLINHPLDCPICDRGGECPLQDQALNFGPGRSRYREQKRHFRKPIALSELVMLDRERCVLCWRCVRFCREVSGDKEIELLDRGSMSQINRGPDEPFDSYFSGNTIQICPVGALTAKPYRFLSRPWDLLTTSSVCSFCAVGCSLSVEQRGSEVLRAQALPNDAVNGFWNCDKGRYGHRYASAADRLGAPLFRRPAVPAHGLPETFDDVPWDVALEHVTDVLRTTIAEYGPEAVGFIGGSHTTNEDLYAANLLFREVVGTPNLDFRTFDATFDYGLFGRGGVVGSSAQLADLDKARTILWFGPDPKEELPVLYLRLRQAVTKGAKLLVAHPRRISLCDFGTHLAYTPGLEAELVRGLVSMGAEAPDCGLDREIVRAAAHAMAQQPVVFCIGQQFVGRRAPQAWTELAAWSRSLERSGRGTVLLCVPNANSQGSLDLGVYPGLAPGHRPGTPGLGTIEMLTAAADGRIKFLWLMGADVLTDVPDAGLAETALRSGAFIVVSELFPTATALSADVVLPAASFAEKEGTYTNFERRLQRVNPPLRTQAGARADWHVFLDLCDRLGKPQGLTTARDIAGAIARTVATHAGFNWEMLGDSWSAVAGPADLPPELWHPAGESGPLPIYQMSPTLVASEVGAPDGKIHVPDKRMTTSWPLRWELRAVDATKRRGWVWPSNAAVGPNPVRSEGAAAPDPAGEAAPPDRSLMLLVGRGLYDSGAMVSRSPDLRVVTPEAFVELHPDEVAARGLVPGDAVTVTSPKGSVAVVLRSSTDTPPGAAYMLLDQPGAGAGVLLDAGASATHVVVAP